MEMLVGHCQLPYIYIYGRLMNIEKRIFSLKNQIQDNRERQQVRQIGQLYLEVV